MNESRTRTGRPPGPHGDTLAKLLPAALQLFLDEGGAALTPTRLHAESGVARATIYRNWPDPADLIEVMLERATEQPDPSAFTGDLTPDLHTATDQLLERFAHKPVRAFFAACLEYRRHSERVALAAEGFIAGITEPFHAILRSAHDAGRLRIDTDPIDTGIGDVVAELAGPLLFEHVMLGGAVTTDRAHRLVDDIIARYAMSEWR